MLLGGDAGCDYHYYNNLFSRCRKIVRYKYNNVEKYIAHVHKLLEI